MKDFDYLYFVSFEDIAVEKTEKIREELRHFSTDKLKPTETVEKTHVEGNTVFYFGN